MSSPFETAAAEARRIAAEHAATLKNHPSMGELIRVHTGLNALEDLMQQPRTSLGDLLGLGDLTAGGGSQLSRVKFDDFVGMPALDAAKKYLRTGTNARPFAEIVSAIKAGGGKIDDEDKLAVGLSRSTLDIIKIGDAYGLLEHYPNVKRGAKKKKTADVSTVVEADVEAVGDESDEKNEPI